MNRSTPPILAVLLLAVAPALMAAQAQDSAVAPHESAPVVRAVRAPGSIVLDGSLAEPAWNAAPPAREFTQLDPSEGQPASEATEVRVLYDDEALYIGARMYDSGPVSSRLGRRDAYLAGVDWLTVTLDSYHDHSTAFRFQVNPAGVRGDQALSSDYFGDASWDPVWEAKTSVDSAGWTAELRIPFSQLRFSREQAQRWGIQVSRTISRRQELAVLSFTPKRERGGIARYGHLEGIEGIRTARRLELLPYTVARAEYRDARPGDPFRDGSDLFGGAGADLKYRISSNLTLDATVNPDFGQVELDPAQINLSAFELYFQERRPFFVEGASIFNFGGGGDFVCFGCPQVFYSRRIGGPPQGVPEWRLYGSGYGAAFVDYPESSTILGAAKLTGRTAGGWSLGILEAVTAREQAVYVDTAGVRRQAAVEPLTSYFVGRLRKDARQGQTTVGGMLTAVNRDLDGEAMRAGLRASAYVGGLDFKHEWGRRSWSLTGAVTASHVTGDSTAILAAQRAPARYFQRPDADHLEVDPRARRLGGYAATLALGKQAGTHWMGRVSASATSPGYEINDLGFQFSVDRVEANGHVSYVENRPGRVLRSWNVNGGSGGSWNFGGDRLGTSVFVGGYGQLTSYWSGGLNLSHSFGGLDDRLTRGGPLARSVAGDFVSAFFSSDFRKPVTLSGNASYSRNDAGGWRWSVGQSVGFKSSPRWTLNLGPSFSRSRTAAQYLTRLEDAGAVSTFGHRYVFAPLEQTTVGLSTRLNYTFSPQITLEAYAQPYIASGDYGVPVALRAPRTFDFVPLDSAATVQIGDRDFNFLSLRGSAVFRWEWRRGSTLYAVWQQQRADFPTAYSHPDFPRLGRLDLARDADRLFGLRPANTFMLKVNYWLNP